MAKAGDTIVFLHGIRKGERGVIKKHDLLASGVSSYVIGTDFYGDYFSTRHGFVVMSCIFNKEGET